MAAFQALERNQYDLVLLDHMMPEMSGFEVLRRIRQEGGPLKDLAIIMLTAETSGTKIAEALEAGADDYITKPVDYPAALARIKTQLTRRQEARELRHREERLSLAAQSTPGGLWEWDFRSGLMYFAPQWKWMLGYEDEAIGDHPDEWRNRIHADDRNAFDEALEQHLAGRCERLECEQRLRMRDGSYRWMSVRGMSERTAGNEPLRMAGVMLDIHDSATLDPLTGLANRSTWMDRLHGRGTVSGGLRAVLLLNLDGFRSINDFLGHAAGDRLLVETAARLREVCAAFVAEHPSTGVMLARTDSDDFAVLIEWSGATASHQESSCEESCSDVVKSLADALMSTVRRPLALSGQQVFCAAGVGASIGDGSAEILLQQSADALRTAKLGGRNTRVIYDECLLPPIQPRPLLESDLTRALQQGEIVVYYQPRVRIADGVICGFEALARWQHPERGLVAPNDFIPMAEKCGLIVELGDAVLRAACRQMTAWQLQFPEYPQLDMSVNLSARQCQEPELVSGVAAILSEAGLAPGRLHLELTESMLLRNFDEAKKVLLGLKSLGVGLKVDDFGTGYSSLRYLGELPFDTLKIDRCFISALGCEQESAREMVRMILTMATSLHLEAIAEGVESPEQLKELRDLGCGYAQGYYFSPPVPPDKIEQMLCPPFGEKQRLSLRV